MNQLIQTLFSLPVCSAPDELSAWWPWMISKWSGVESLTSRAVIGGALSERVGLAFAAGYQCALRALFAGLPEDAMGALCATEAGGAHPKAIQTTLTKDGDEYRLTGKKTFITMAEHAKVLLIVAKEEEQLRVVRVDREEKPNAVVVTPLPSFPFVPEIPHAEAELSQTLITQAQVLPGDGYELYLKPFRTIEDVYVHLAMAGHFFGTARKYQWPTTAIEDILSLLSSWMPLASMTPLGTETHLTIAGVIRSSRRLIDSLEPHWSLCPTEVQERWQRDKQLLRVAEKVRQLRTESAWKKMTLLTKL